jgi:hypothetical protein
MGTAVGSVRRAASVANGYADMRRMFSPLAAGLSAPGLRPGAEPNREHLVEPETQHGQSRPRQHHRPAPDHVIVADRFDYAPTGQTVGQMWNAGDDAVKRGMARAVKA